MRTDDHPDLSESATYVPALVKALNASRWQLNAKGLGREMGLGNHPALLIVDMQRGFTDPDSPLGASVPNTVANVERLLNAARRASLPVVYTVCLAAPKSSVWQRKLPANAILTPESKWVEVEPQLTPAHEEVVVRKHFASAFFGTDLHDRLGRLGVDSLIVTGMTTSGCVRASVVDGCSLGYQVLVPAEAVADRIEASHLVSLFDMDLKYADVVSTEDVVSRLSDTSAGSTR